MPHALVAKGRGAWVTPAGKQVEYVITEHAVVLAGVDATGVHYADPYIATMQSATYGDFEEAMHALDNRAVILRP